MLTGLYGYIFGDEGDSNDSITSQENIVPSQTKVTEDDWCMVEDFSSGRNSPVLVPHPEIRDIDSLSFSSKKATQPPSAEAIRRSEELRQAKTLAAHRLQLERVLFADVDVPLSLQTPAHKKNVVSAGKLKRASAVALVSSDSKTKSRSKKAGKMSSGRNNDRKVNNLD